MILSKKIFILTVAIFFIYTLVLIFYFNSNINNSFELFNIQKQKDLLSLSLSYNKKLYEIGDEPQKQELLKEYNFIKNQQAYIVLLEFYKKKIINGIIVSTLILSLIILSILFFILVFMLRQFLYPFQQVILSLDNYMKHKKVDKINLKGNNEVKNFLSNFNNIINKLILNRAEEKIKSSFQNWQTLAKIIVHEIKNQISPVNLNLESMIYYNEEIHLKKGLENIRKNLDSIENIVNNFRNLSNLPEPVCSNINTDELLENSFSKLNIPLDKYSFKNEENRFSVFSDKFYLELIFTNLLKNARESNNIEKLKIDIEYDIINTKKIIIKDNGQGIPDDVLPKIFKPGFTTKSNGDGIGLFLVKELCNCLGIKINVYSKINIGTNITLDFGNE